MLAAGHKQHYLSHARHEATRAAKRLSTVVGEAVEVTAVLVEPKDLTVKQAPADVHVITDRRLLRWLRRRRPVLTAEQVAGITAAAVIPGTWHNNPAPPEEPVVLQERYASLRATVRSAQPRQWIWQLGWRLGGFLSFFFIFGSGLLEAALNASLG